MFSEAIKSDFEYVDDAVLFKYCEWNEYMTLAFVLNLIMNMQ